MSDEVRVFILMHHDESDADCWAAHETFVGVYSTRAKAALAKVAFEGRLAGPLWEGVGEAPEKYFEIRVATVDPEP